MMDSEEAIDALKDTAHSHEELFQNAIIGDRAPEVHEDPEEWMSVRARRLLKIVKWVEGLKNFFPMEIVESRAQMEEFEQGTPFMVIIPAEQSQIFPEPIPEERVLVIKSPDGDWLSTHDWGGSRRTSFMTLTEIWEGIEDEREAVVIALPVPISVPMIPFNPLK